MATFKNDPFPGTDYSKFLTWEKVVTPSGQTFYVVPGNPAYVYDPVASNASGRKVFRANPKGAISEAEEQKKQQDKAIQQQQFNQSPVGQLLPIAGVTGGTILASQLGGKAADPVSEAIAKEIGKRGLENTITGNAAPQTLGQAAAQGAQGGAIVAPEGTGTLGAPVQDFSLGGVPQPDGSVVTNTLPEGSEVAPDGSIIDADTGATIGRAIQGLGGAYQIYSGFQEFKRDKVGGGLGIASGAANVGAALGSETLGQVAAPLAIAKGGYDVVGAFNRNGEGLRSGTTSLGAGIGSMLLPGVGTGIGAAAGNVIGYGLQGNGIKNDLALAAMGPVGWGLLGAKKTGLIDKLMHKTTRQVAQEHTGQLQKQGQDDKNWQNYVAGMREQFNAAPPDPSKPFAGKYKTWEDYKKGGLEAADLTGVYGNLKVYGPEWANLTQEQRQAITQANIESGLYESKKGEVEITDEQKAIENKNNVLKGFEVGAKATTPPVVNPPTKPVVVLKAPAPAKQGAAVAAARGFTGRA